MAQDDDVVLSHLCLLRGEGPAESGLAAEHIEEIECDARAVEAFGLASAGEVEPLIAERGDAREGVVLIAVAEIISRGEGELRKSGLEIAFAHDHELLGFVEPQRLEQHGVDHREDGGIRSDSQGESEDRNAGEPRVATQGAEGVAEVAEYGRKHGYGLDEGERRALARVGRVQIVDPRARRVHHGFSTMMFPNFVLVFGFLDRLSPPENSHHG